MTEPRDLPYSIEAEQSVLGGLMLDNRSWNDVVDRLGDTDFYRADHQLIWRAICELVGSNRPCDFITLTEYLRDREQLEQAGGVAYLGTLANDTPSAANVLAYADIVRERSVLRNLIGAGGQIAELGFRPEGRDPRELLDVAEQQVFAIRERGIRTQSGYLSMAQVLPEVQNKVMQLRENPDEGGGLRTGFVDLDRMTNGLQAGDLVIVAGRPSMGKTTFAMHIAEPAAFEKQVPVAVFSMEMSAEQLGYRVLSSRGGIDQSNLRSGKLDDREMDQLSWVVGKLRKAPLFIDETGALSPLELRARARRLAMRESIGLLVVDYIQLMQVPGTRDNRSNEIAEISRSLKSLGKELGVPVIALSQLNRGVEQRDNKRPRMADLRESGGIEQDADIVLFIYRDEVYNKESPDQGTAEIIIAKQRNGPTGMVKTAFFGRYTRFDNLAHGEEDFHA